MLEYKISTHDNVEERLELIELNNLYRAEDGSFISGTTPSANNLKYEKQLVLYYPNNGLSFHASIETEEVVRKGYVEYNVVYPIEPFCDDYGNIVYGIRYEDGQVYYCQDESGASETGDFIIVRNKDYSDSPIYYDVQEVEDPLRSNKAYSAVTCPHRAYIDNDEVTIDGVTYNIEIDCDGDVTYLFNLPAMFDFTDKVHGWKSDEWEELTHVIVRKEDDVKLDIDQAYCAEAKYYLYYGQEFTENAFGAQVDAIMPKLFFQKYTEIRENLEGATDFSDMEDLDKLMLVNVDGQIYSAYTEDAHIQLGNDKVKIEETWVNSLSSDNHLFLYVSNENIAMAENDEILAVNDFGTTRCEVHTDDENGSYIVFNGAIYAISDEDDTRDYIKINGDDLAEGEEYEIFFYKEEQEGTSYIGYYNFNDKNNLVRVDTEKNVVSKISSLNGGEYTIFSGDTLELVRYRYVRINGNCYNVQEQTNTLTETISDDGYTVAEVASYYVDVDEKEEILFIVDEVANGNQVRCHPYSPYIDVNMFYRKFKDFSFYLKNILYRTTNIGEMAYDDSINFYKIQSYFNLPIKLTFEGANNLFQDIIVNRDFYQYEKEKSINRIVDMEKDIYYPTFDDKDRSYVDKISFMLHFRTRDLEEWKVKEDTEDSNWNIIDYYYDNLHNYDFLENTPMALQNKLYQPSDLVYYLNFTDNDVYYQKSKIKKSFLRILFYDSDNPMTQNLLATSTIFMDSSKLYKNYCVNSNPNVNDDYGFFSMNDGEYTEYSGVYKEPCGRTNKKLSFDEDERIEATFTVENMYNDKCSEGFYLYLFKEYSSALHERTIYMKIQFNHAGTGRVVNLLVPTQEDGIDKPLDLTVAENRTYFKQGYPLDEIASRMYTKIKVKFDETKKRFVYSLPSAFRIKDTSNAVFNLYEVKIKDES